jgi:TonB family protein
MLRRDSAAWLLPQDIVQLRLHLAPHADIRLHDTLEQPVTFGICRPVVLVPRSIDGLRSAEQCAVICHELVHVARRDWISLLSEEGVRSLCWFHPAVRWAIARLQLAREQRVDEIAVAVTADRGAYMRMLIGFASAAPLATPVVAFTRRRDLLARLRLISQEVAMSPIRAAFVCLGLLTFLGVIGTGAAFALPVPVVAWQATADRLTASRRFEGVRPLTAGVNLQSADGVTRQTPSVDSPTPRSTVTRIAAVYPAALTPHLVNAVVRVQVTVDAAGQVDDVQLLSARAWPGDACAETAAIIDSLHADGTNPFVIAATSAARLWRFATAADQQRAYTDLSFTFRATGAGGNAFVSAPPPPPPPPPNAASQSRGFVPARGSVRPGEPVPPPPPAPPSPPQPVRVGGNVPAPRKVKDVRPVYPPGAKASGISGVVIAEVWVGVDGTVKNARVLRSVPALDQAALDAVLQWEYEPVLVNGAATDVVMVVTVNFTLTN